MSLNHQAINKTVSIEHPLQQNAQNVTAEAPLPEDDAILEADYWMLARVLIDFYEEGLGMEREQLLGEEPV